MSEQEYIIVTNLAKIRNARAILSEILPGDEYGIDKKTFQRLKQKIYAAEVKCAKLIKLTVENEDAE